MSNSHLIFTRKFRLFLYFYIFFKTTHTNPNLGLPANLGNIVDVYDPELALRIPKDGVIAVNANERPLCPCLLTLEDEDL